MGPFAEGLGKITCKGPYGNLQLIVTEGADPQAASSISNRPCCLDDGTCSGTGVDD
jgi:hypothetical protein